jgi:actin-related protein
LIANQHELGMDLNEITLSVDRVKCNEVYFQPSLIGVDQCGIIDAIMLSIRDLGGLNQQKLMSNIVLAGGGALTAGLAARIKIDLQKECL